MKKILSISNSKEKISKINEIAKNSGLAYANIPYFADFLSHIEDENIEAVILQNEDLDSIIKWVKVIKDITPHIPIIVVSGNNNTTKVKELYSHNIFYFCIPPISSEILKQVIDSAISFHQRESKKINQSFNREVQ